MSLLLVATCAVAVSSAMAETPAYAPLAQPGPALSVPLEQLKASLYCEPSVSDAKVEPVLLNPATGVTPEENYSWNWEPALEKLEIPWCAYTAPNHTLGDISTSGEYLVYAIRTMYAMAGRRIAIVGHSQGGMSMRWPLRFWPDTRAMVEDVIGFSGTNHGTTVGGSTVCASGCPPADWQQGYQSNFIRALNSDAETFRGISYTEIYTHTDEVVEPATGPNPTAALYTGRGMITNVATQQICPNDRYEHLTIGTIDPVAYALAVDALTHPGPADPARIPRSVCSQLYMPGVNPLDLNTYLQNLDSLPTLASVSLGPLSAVTAGAPVVRSEPALPCYVFATCAPTTALSIKVAPARAVLHRRTRLRFAVTVDIDGVVSPVPGAAIWVGNGRRLTTDDAGRAAVTLAFGKAGRRHAIATANEYFSDTATIRVTRPRRKGRVAPASAA
jgi:hypothetical protein